MKSTTSKTLEAVTPADIRDRGGDLAHRLRVAGCTQYTVWFAQVNPEWKGDTETAKMIRLICNERGGMKHLPLLRKCEALADKYLPKQAA